MLVFQKIDIHEPFTWSIDFLANLFDNKLYCILFSYGHYLGSRDVKIVIDLARTRKQWLGTKQEGKKIIMG